MCVWLFGSSLVTMDVLWWTSQVASASSSVGASPTGSGVPEAPLSVKSAGASPPQSSSKHLHINLGNQFRPGGSLPNVNNNVNMNAAKDPSGTSAAIHSIDLKVLIFPVSDLMYFKNIVSIFFTTKNAAVC